jgi:hypothetical protein
MEGDRSTVEIGMAVLGAKGHTLGTVKEVGDDTILIDRTLQPAVRMPLTSIQAVVAGSVKLSHTGAQVNDEWWAHAGEDVQRDTSGLYD